jgi:hypothetical protein
VYVKVRPMPHIHTELCVRYLLVCWCCWTTLDFAEISSEFNCIKNEIRTILQGDVCWLYKDIFCFQNIVRLYGKGKVK